MRSKSLGIRAGGGALVLCLAPALALGGESMVMDSLSPAAWVGGLFAGQSNLKSYSCTDCGSEVGSLDDTDTAWGGFFGYQAGPYLGVHIGYVDLGETTAAGVDGDWTDRLEADGSFFRLRGTLPLGNFYSFVEAGILLWDQKVTFNSDSFSDSGSFDGTDPMFGLGAGYRFGPVGVEASYTRFQDVGTTDPDLGHQNDIDLIAFNVVYFLGR